MKNFILLFVIFCSNSVFANYSCTDNVGVVLNISESFRAEGVTFKSEELSLFYKKEYGVDIKELVTIVVDETREIMFYPRKNGYESLLRIPDSEIFNLLWNIKIEFIPGTPIKAKVAIIEMAGYGFQYLVECKKAGSLE